MAHFTDAERALLAQYVTNADDDVYAVTGLPGIVGAVYARYSRAKGGFRETLLNEFVSQGVIDPAKAEQLIERVLIAFGDDSVGELEGGHLCLENISILATKEFEDRRIGGSPIEQSTRYVFYDQRDGDGNFRYYRDPEVMASPHAAAYAETMDAIFRTYCDLIEPMKAYYAGLKPISDAEYDINGDGVKERLADCTDDAMRKAFRVTWNADVRTKACDTLRALLPVATKTNVGIFGNGRFFQHVLTHCYTSPLPEANDLAGKAHAALRQVLPQYVKRARRNEYRVSTDDAMAKLVTRLFPLAQQAQRENAPGVRLETTDLFAVTERCRERPGYVPDLRDALAYEEDSMTLAQMLYPYCMLPLAHLHRIVTMMDVSTRVEIWETYVGNRRTRRDRPGRALEDGYRYTFDLVTDFGAYKDLERHRMMTQQRQKFTPLMGFVMPEDLALADKADPSLGAVTRAQRCVEQAQRLYELLLPDFPEQASYATLHGSLVRWTCGINDRALMHMIELRTTPQGHPAYRKVCQVMHKLVAERSPWRARAMAFADHGDYFWSRGDAEAKQRVKEAALDQRNDNKQSP